MSAYFYICTHTLVLNLSEPVILRFLCCILQGGVPVEAGVGVAGAVEAGERPGPAPVDGNDSCFIQREPGE